MIRLTERVNCKIVTPFGIKFCMIRFLKDRMSTISSELYEKILKPNKSHTNRIIQTVPCKGGKAVLHGAICMIRFVWLLIGLCMIRLI